MKALTLTQPWATLVAVGAKKIETRSWETKYRGPIAIHAAKGFPLEAQELCFDDPFNRAISPVGDGPWALPRGAVVATAVLSACWQFDSGRRYIVGSSRDEHVIDLTEPELSFGDFTPGRYGWLLTRINRLGTPIPVRGALGLWEWSP